MVDKFCDLVLGLLRVTLNTRVMDIHHLGGVARLVEGVVVESLLGLDNARHVHK